MSEGPQAIVVGAGITGLACARTLKKLGIETIVLESSQRVGGVVRSEKRDGYLVEAGPNSFLPTAHTFQLLDGLTDGLIEADSKSPRYVCIGGQLRRVPFGPLTAGGIARALAEPFVRSKATEDESVAHFFRRRLGAQVQERLVSAFVTGIYAGDAERLSIAATFPRLVEVERDYGSIMLGMMRAAKKSRADHKSGAGADADAAKPRRSVSSTFSDGMETLPRRLSEGLNVQLGATGIRIGKTVQAAATVITTPAFNAAEIVEKFNSRLAGLLQQIRYEPIVIAATSVADETLQVPIRGFGFLVPPRERLNILGTVFNSSLFLDRAPAGHQLLTSFVGGALRPEAFDWPDGRVWDIVCSELKSVLKLELQPKPVAVFRYRRAIPQYAIGHLAWRRALNAELERCPGLFITGNYLDGVSVPACLEQGEKMAHTVADYLRGGK